MDPRHLSLILTRRELLRGAVMLVGGIVSATPIDLWAENASKARFFSESEFALLDEVCEIIIPQTDTPGARGAGVPGALDMLMRQWASKKHQKQFLALLKDFDQAALLGAGKSLLQLPPEQRIKVVAQYDAANFKQPLDTPPKDQKPYPAFKNLVLRLYYVSEVGATQELNYEHVPGAWEPVVKLTSGTRTWASPNG